MEPAKDTPADAAAMSESSSGQQQPATVDNSKPSGEAAADQQFPPQDLSDDVDPDEDDVEITSDFDDDQILAALNDDEPAVAADSGESAPAVAPAESEPAESKTEDTPIKESEQKESEQASDSQPNAEVSPPTSDQAETVEKEADEVPPDPQAIAVALDEQKTLVVTALFGDERPMQSQATQAVAAYTAALNAAANAAVLEDNPLEQIAADVRERHVAALLGEKSLAAENVASTQGEIERYETLFTELDRLIESVAEEMEARQDSSEEYQNAPEELQSRLSNYKKGIEIIHRMFSKVKERKKDLADKNPGSLNEEYQPTAPPDENDGATMWLGQLLGEFHSIRDANYHVVQDGKKLADSCGNASRSAVNSLLSAIDGIDSGLQNEPSTLDALAPFREEHQELLDTWFGAYDRLSNSVDQFLEKTGVQAVTVKRGTPFDPESMDPLGMVDIDAESDPDFDPNEKGEFVAAVLRRGFSLGGVLIRPVQVDVVKIS